jgi:hypothetical protein
MRTVLFFYSYVYSHAARLFILKNRTVPNLKGAKPFLKPCMKSYNIMKKKMLPLNRSSGKHPLFS